ncbi:MAG: ferric reductase-like transmembrane domain-containing protein [Actinomycetota bacterium]
MAGGSGGSGSRSGQWRPLGCCHRQWPRLGRSREGESLLSGRALWYLTRGTGVVALILLTFSLVLGIVEVRRWARPAWPRFLTAGLHRNVSLLSVAFVAAHVATSVLDRYAPIGWLDGVVPFGSAYRPIWLGLGAVAFDLMVALIVTSLIRAKIGYPVWKIVHWSSYACWPVALVHSIGTGSDTRQPWELAVLLACLAAAGASVVWRLAIGRPETAGARTILGLSAVVALGALVGWSVAGPLQAGWAARAGTPSSLLGAASRTGGGYAPDLTPPFTAQLSGTTAESPAADGAGVELFIDGLLTGGATGRLDAAITGTPLGAGGLSMQASTISLGTAGHQDLYQGELESLNEPSSDGSSFVADVDDGSGDAMTLTVTLSIDQRAGTVAGTVSAVPEG